MRNEEMYALESLEFLMSDMCPDLSAMLDDVEEFDIPEEEDMNYIEAIKESLNYDTPLGWEPHITGIECDVYYYRKFSDLVKVIVDKDEVTFTIGNRDVIMSIPYFSEHAIEEYPELGYVIAEVFTLIYKHNWF